MVALLHQGAQLPHRREDRGCVGGLPLQRHHHAAAGAVLQDPGELAPLPLLWLATGAENLYAD